jgi:hypothetical protein
MFQIKVTSNFDPKRLSRQLGDAAVRKIEQACHRAAVPYGGVTVTIKRDEHGAPSGISLSGSEEAIEAAKKALQQ